MRDLLAEATYGITVRPGRTALTVVGVLLGTAALVATIGVAQTAGNRIVNRLDVLAATTVSLQPRTVPDQSVVVPWDAASRAAQLNGVVAASTLVRLGATDAHIATNPRTSADRPTASVFASGPGLPDAVGGSIGAGRFFDVGHDQRGDPVAVLGAGTAAHLHIADLRARPAIFVDSVPVTVIGILDSVESHPELLNAVIVPDGYARSRFGLTAPGVLIVRTDIGAAQLIGSQLAVAVDPQHHDAFAVSVPPEPVILREAVSTDLNSLLVILGVVALAVGAVGIANVTLVSVLERTGEIGLRRALGASRARVAAQYLLESSLQGLLGGILGATTGILVLAGVAVARDWLPVLDPLIAYSPPVLGVVTGLLAGGYPAWRAATIDPVVALRQLG
jgi:putative ABC transport system permease protein